MDLNLAKLLYPKQKGSSGSNNWAVSGGLSASGYPLLATDPHQPHSIPNTFFYSHLSTPDWDAFGASFPGVPYFMMGFNQHVAWGLTTGFVDTYDVFVERGLPETSKSYVVDVAREGSRSYTIAESRHGPILESLTDALGITTPCDRNSVTSLDWVMRDLPTSAGILALMPLANSSEELGDSLFENDVSPLVNTIISVDRNNDMRRFIATTIRKRPGHNKAGVTGVVPLPGWDSRYYFETSRAHELLVDHNPGCGYMFTANNDTMGDSGDYPIHNFPISDARARRIEQLLKLQLEEQLETAGAKFTADDFTAMQMDLVDLRAKDLLPSILKALDSDSGSKELQLAKMLLSSWDCVADMKSKAACIFYPLLAKQFNIEFMKSVLGDSAVLDTLASVAPGLNRFRIDDFMCDGSPWLDHHGVDEGRSPTEDILMLRAHQRRPNYYFHSNLFVSDKAIWRDLNP